MGSCRMLRRLCQQLRRREFQNSRPPRAPPHVIARRGPCVVKLHLADLRVMGRYSRPLEIESHARVLYVSRAPGWHCHLSLAQSCRPRRARALTCPPAVPASGGPLSSGGREGLAAGGGICFASVATCGEQRACAFGPENHARREGQGQDIAHLRRSGGVRGWRATRRMRGGEPARLARESAGLERKDTCGWTGDGARRGIWRDAATAIALQLQLA